jgi:hypothetical protein
MGEEGEQESRNWTSDIAAVAVYSGRLRVLGTNLLDVGTSYRDDPSIRVPKLRPRLPSQGS